MPTKNRLLDLFTSPTGGDGPRSAAPQFDAERVRSAAEQWIAKNPAVALGAALAVGVFLGGLMKRK
jgi:ElaB/YqjD/DUF883 family membrane-anchored ribosome-binding protein